MPFTRRLLGKIICPARSRREEGPKDMTVKRMDDDLIDVDDLEAVKAFFIALGLELEGRSTVEGPSIGSLRGLGADDRPPLIAPP